MESKTAEEILFEHYKEWFYKNHNIEADEEIYETFLEGSDRYFLKAMNDFAKQEAFNFEKWCCDARMRLLSDNKRYLYFETSKEDLWLLYQSEKVKP